MKKIVIPLIVLALLASAAVWRSKRGKPEAAPLRMYGNVDIREVDMSFRQPGRIVRLRFDEGASVRKGTLLAELDAQPFQDAVKVAQAARAQALAELEKLRNGNRKQEIAQAAETVRQAEAAAAEAERHFERQSSLLASGAASERTVEAAKSARDQTKAGLSAAREVHSLRAEGARTEDIAAAEARVAGAEAQLAQAQTALSDTRLVAPENALVSTRIREAGSMVAANVPVYTLSLLEPAYVRAYVGQTDLTKVRPGGDVIVRADGTSETFRGTIGFISPKAEFTPKSVETTELRTELVYRIRIVVPGAGKTLRQGMPVTVELAGPSGK